MKRSALFLSGLALVSMPAVARAQVDTGSILGTVHDPSRAPVDGATLTITETKTNAVTSVKTNSSGDYIATPLRIGTYSVSVVAPGFKKETRSGVVLRVQDRLRIDFKLEVGGVEEAVVVSGEAPLVQADTSSMGEVIESRQIESLPLNGRNYLDLATLTVGVTRTDAGTNGNVGGLGSTGLPSSFVANGTRGTLNNFMLDGIDNNSNDNAGAILRTSIDAIEEFKVQTSTYSSEFGRSAGAVINASIKSGSNDWTGTAIYMLRDESLDARGFFDDPTQPKAPFSFHQFGATLGGPIKKDKTFFFADYQGTRTSTATTAIYTVPTAAQRAGDFSEEGNPVIFDPQTGQPFPGNVIPADRTSPLGQSFITQYPLPNQPGLKNNYLVAPAIDDHIDQADLRLDHSFSEKDRVFARGSWSDRDLLTPPPFPGIANGGDYGTGHIFETTWGGVLGHTHIVSSQTVNELRLGFNRAKIQVGIPPGGTSFPPAELQVPGVPNDPRINGLTYFAPNAYSALGDSPYIPTYITSMELHLADALTLVRGRHALKVGFQFRRSYFDLFQIPYPRGSVQFSGEFTQDLANPEGTGDGLADALLGLVSQADISNITDVKNRTNVFGVFVQDDYKVNDRLTLNLGLRYDYTGPTVSADDRQSNFDYGTGQILVANQNGNSRGLIDVDKLNFAPRVGFAWTATADGKTVVRGGYGIFYSPQEIRTAFQLAYNLPFFYGISQTSDYGVTPAILLDEGFPPLDPAAAAFPQVTSVDRRFRSPYFHQWNVGFQRELPFRMMVEVAYVGSRGRRLQVMRDRNQPTPGPGDVQERRPYPQYGTFSSIENAGESRFNSLQVKLSKRLSQGLWFLSAFTLAKATNDQPEICCAEVWPANTYDIAAEVGRADFDQRTRWVTSFGWELPFGKGRRYLDREGALDAIFGGWELGGILTLASGFPFSPHMGVDPSNTGTFGQLRPDQIRDGNLPSDQRTPEHWFDVDAYRIPAEFTFGNAKRNSLEGPGFKTLDLYLRKDFRISGKHHLQVRVDLFNAFNHPNFGLPDPNVDAGEGSAGVITSTSIPMRQIQLGLRYSF
jgi:outer membrane receptor protein involved in Fe transport